MKNFDKRVIEYYYNYLEYKEKSNIICSENRNKNVNIFKYPIIVSFYKDKTIYSISPKYYKELKEEIENEQPETKDEITNILKQYFKNKDNIQIQEMKRMTKEEKTNIDISRVTKIEERHKNEYFNSFEKNNDIEYKEKKWKQIKEYKYFNGIIQNNQIVSAGFVSNIDYSGANIVIQTKGKYQNRGYGSAIVEKISRDLLQENKIPVYWVNIENAPSIHIAEKTGFKEISTEIVVRLPNNPQ